MAYLQAKARRNILVEDAQSDHRERREEDVEARHEPVVVRWLAGERCVGLVQEESHSERDVLVEEVAYLQSKGHIHDQFQKKSSFTNSVGSKNMVASAVPLKRSVGNTNARGRVASVPGTGTELSQRHSTLQPEMTKQE